MSFCYWRLRGVTYEPLVGMCCFVYEYIDYFGVFGIVDRFRDVTVQTAGMERGSYLYSSQCTVMLGGLICSGNRQRWNYGFTMSSLEWIGCHDVE
ncbi:hypothetical protein F2Q69_00030755 [Brassica cretica]|uniref:Uncharacterized protein n=1 Tax=Brassica cretica TaxID=69181 RepID=A0A8S9S7I7_BRACR|nr:hypothetical protein F2Q69_00030755 [Brassica cretica]